MNADAPPPRVTRLAEGGRAAWDGFVGNAPGGSVFHLSGWRAVIEETLGHRAHYLMAESAAGTVLGVLPLVHVKSRLFSNALISTAFCVRGGPLAIDPQVESALDRSALALAGELDVDYIEYRLDRAAPEGWVGRSDLYATFRKPIHPEPEANLLAIPRKQRAMVRKGIKLGLASEIDATAERFYRLYAESVRNLGTPVLPLSYFAALKREFGAACQILTIVGPSGPLAGVMSFRHRDEIVPYYGGGGEAARTFAANDFMYWEVMRRACLEGCALFDFGRSKAGSGAYEFKRHWGFEPTPLTYAYRRLRGQGIPQINPLNPKYRAFIAAWKRLPLALANRLGPLIARDLG